MTCPSVADWQQFVDGPEPGPRDQLQLHLAQCAICRALLLAVSPETTEALQAARALERPPVSILPRDTPVGRYVVRERIGQGGMGVVYAAHDPELDRLVALKVLRVDPTGDEAAVRTRVQREAQALARLAHPNVVAVYDVGTSAHGIFIAMEMVDGETLRAWLRQPRPWRTVLDVFVHAGRGLEAAHHAGLIHRDFKPDNVLVGKDGRVRVTDFGLARLTGTEDTHAPTVADSPLTLSVTRTGALLGTPAYMAPEQLCGDPVDARADIFSFCVALYEALYRTRPFIGNNVAELRVAIVQNRVAKPPPSRVPRRPQKVLARGLRAAPEERFATMGELLAALDVAARPLVRRGAALAALALLALLLLVAAIVGRTRHPPAAWVVSHGRPAVAVLRAHNRGDGDADWLATALEESVAAALTAGERVHVVAPAEVARAQGELGPGEPALDATARAQLRRRLGADFLVTGRFREQRGRVSVELQLVDVASGDHVALDDETVPDTELDTLAERLAAGVRQRLGLPSLGPGEAQLARTFPSRPEAMRAYAEGLMRQRAFDARGARERLERAVAVEPDNPMVHSALAQAWTDLGFTKKAQDEAERAFNLSSGLTREQRLSLEAQYLALARRWPRAIEIDRALVTFFPDNLDYRLLLAQAQARAGQGQEALATVASTRQLPHADGDPRVSMAEERAAYYVTDFKHMRAAAERAAAEARAVHAPLYAGFALYRAGVAMRELGDLAGAATVDQQARQILHDAGDRAGEAQAITELAVVARMQGRLSDALPLFETAIAVARTVGNEWYLINYEGKLAIALQQVTQMARAKQLYEEGLARARALGEHLEIGSLLTNYSNVQLALGDLDGAIASVAEAQSIYKDTSERRWGAMAHLMMAELLRDRDRLVEARAEYDQAMQVLGDKAHPFISASYVGAELALTEDRLREAEAGFREVLNVSAWGDVGLKADSWGELGRTLLAEGRTAEARRVCEHAEPLLAKMENRFERLCATLLLAEVRGRSGGADERAAALRTLRETLAEATRDSLVSIALDARLALGRVEAADGQREAARAELQTVADEAARRGFMLVARRARQALSRR
jgi:tetratricopeptide (TPR) repeat protein